MELDTGETISNQMSVNSKENEPLKEENKEEG